MTKSDFFGSLFLSSRYSKVRSRIFLWIARQYRSLCMLGLGFVALSIIRMIHNKDVDKGGARVASFPGLHTQQATKAGRGGLGTRLGGGKATQFLNIAVHCILRGEYPNVFACMHSTTSEPPRTHTHTHTILQTCLHPCIAMVNSTFPLPSLNREHYHVLW